MNVLQSILTQMSHVRKQTWVVTEMTRHANDTERISHGTARSHIINGTARLNTARKKANITRYDTARHGAMPAIGIMIMLNTMLVYILLQSLAEGPTEHKRMR